VYVKYVVGLIYVSDDSPVNKVDHGIFFISFHDVRVKGITRALHILVLAQNLRSIRKLNDVGV
jgi:hypothetical protein